MAAATLDTPPPLDDLGKVALFLDFDGTLVNLAETPDAITVPAHLSDALERKAASLDRRLAIVTGRFIADVRKHLPDCHVVVSGSHGAEIASPDGSSIAEQEVPRIEPAALEAARDFAARTPGLHIEEKDLGVGMHYRECPDRKDAILAFTQDLAQAHGLYLREGKMLAELTTTDANKGDGVRPSSSATT